MKPCGTVPALPRAVYPRPGWAKRAMQARRAGIRGLSRGVSESGPAVRVSLSLRELMPQSLLGEEPTSLPCRSPCRRCRATSPPNHIGSSNFVSPPASRFPKPLPQFPRHRHHRSFLGVFPSSFGELQAPGPQITVLSKRPQNVMRSLHQHRRRARMNSLFL